MAVYERELGGRGTREGGICSEIMGKEDDADSSNIIKSQCFLTGILLFSCIVCLDKCLSQAEFLTCHKSSS